MRLTHLALLLSFSLTACNGGNGNTDTDTGTDIPVNTSPDRYFRGVDSQALGASGNQADCALCHSDTEIQLGFSGYPLNDSAYLTDFKGSREDGFLGATNFCLVEFMGADPGFGELNASDPRYVSLIAYIESISYPIITTSRPEDAEVLADLPAYAAAYSGGDPAAGESSFMTWCAPCHLPRPNAPQITLTLGDINDPRGVTAAPDTPSLATRTTGVIAQKVRTSGTSIPSSLADDAADDDKTLGPMPFFLPSILPAEELKNIIAYIQSDQLKACAGPDDCPTSRVCGSDGACAAPRCDDNVLNGSESERDCGGACAGCAAGSNCFANSDCASGTCTGGACE